MLSRTFLHNVTVRLMGRCSGVWDFIILGSLANSGLGLYRSKYSYIRTYINVLVQFLCTLMLR
jgi:hypothetical protein